MKNKIRVSLKAAHVTIFAWTKKGKGGNLLKRFKKMRNFDTSGPPTFYFILFYSKFSFNFVQYLKLFCFSSNAWNSKIAKLRKELKTKLFLQRLKNGIEFWKREGIWKFHQLTQLAESAPPAPNTRNNWAILNETEKTGEEN